MNIPDDEFLMNKRDFAKNTICYGLAIKSLSNLTGRSINDCIKITSEEASHQMSRLDPKHIDGFIQQYYIGKQNKLENLTLEL
ncbi:hypothetical protein [Nodularia sp. UHCC 0506]|uniref:hypothetical protein n=1 Tax=Nodularia sp. UHCC 0506 TaxID=3110243 RepID=UPI002B1F8D51|nr:hypothetical protein [Nodularia sp. UHCC 0506]MEA5515523.1 hypothetical protein [Nodularia sp. UHCC 0506]